jgi:hypothetical protein
MPFMYNSFPSEVAITRFGHALANRTVHNSLASKLLIDITDIYDCGENTSALSCLKSLCKRVAIRVCISEITSETNNN